MRSQACTAYIVVSITCNDPLPAPVGERTRRANGMMFCHCKLAAHRPQVVVHGRGSGGCVCSSGSTLQLNRSIRPQTASHQRIEPHALRCVASSVPSNFTEERFLHQTIGRTTSNVVGVYSLTLSFKSSARAAALKVLAVLIFVQCPGPTGSRRDILQTLPQPATFRALSAHAQ